MDAAESVGGPAVVIGKCMNVLVKDATSVSDLEPSGIVEPEDLKILEIITRYDLVTFDHAVLNREVRVYSLSESHGKDYSLLRGGISPGGPCREQLQRCPVPWGGRFDERGRAVVIIPVPDGGSCLRGRDHCPAIRRFIVRSVPAERCLLILYILTIQNCIGCRVRYPFVCGGRPSPVDAPDDAPRKPGG